MKTTYLTLIVPFTIISACSSTTQNPDELTGQWIEELSPKQSFVQGFNLKKEGKAESIGMQTLQYESWEKAAGELILKGKSIGNGQTVLFADTLHIIKHEKDTLVLQKGQRLTTYVRKSAQAVTTDSSQAINPSRAAYEGFEWKKVTGMGITLLAQQNEDIRIMADPSVPGFSIVRNNDPQTHPVIQVFNLKNNDINDVLEILRQQKGWNEKQTCQFQEVKNKRNGVRRYVLKPEGDYARKVNEQMKKEPVPATCNGWGVGNSGMRYFEIYDSQPDKALFIEIGQDAPLFDEQSICFTNSKEAKWSQDILYMLDGTLTIGHEIRTFQPNDSKDAYWIIDKTGTLYQQYDRITNGQKNGKPVHATLKIEYNGKWTDGFASEYPGTFIIREIINLSK